MAVNYAGTISVANGSAVVTGTGTEWTTLTVASDYILVTADGTICKVSALASSTELTLTKNYAGATASNVEYEIFPTIGADVELGLLVKAFIDDASDIIDGGTALLTALQAAYDTWIADRQAEFDAAQSQRATDFTAAQDARASQFATDRAQQDLDIANAMNGLEGAPIARAIPSGAVAMCEIKGASILDLNGGWTQDMSKSWAKEDRVTTTYLGVHNTTASAWAVPGAAAGDWYWDGTNRNIYILTGTAGATLSTLNRFGAAHFDARFAVAYSDRVVLVDGNGVPWMVFKENGSSLNTFWYNGRDASCVEMMGSHLFIGSDGDTWGGLRVCDFAADNLSRRSNAGFYSGRKVSDRNINLALPTVSTDTSQRLVHHTVNAVAAMVLPNAPGDPVTGLPVPTIAIASDGGVSVIKDDGTVVDITTGVCEDVSIVGGGLSIKNGQYVYRGPFPSTDTTIGAWRDWWMDHTSAGSLSLQSQSLGAAVGESVACSNGLTRIWENPANPAAGMVAYQAPDYVTPPMFGDVKSALFCERGAASLVGAEYVVGGDFDNAVSWTASAGSTVSGGKLNVADDVVHESIYNNAGTPFPREQIALVTFEVSNIDANYGVRLCLVNPSNGSILSTLGGTYYTASGSYSVTVTETPSVDWVVGFQRLSGHTGTLEIDNVSVRAVTPDRSVNGKGAVIHGTLSRDADGWVSGFSSNDRVSQPSNSDLNYGTGDFYMMARLKADGSTRYIMDMYGTAGRTYWLINSSGHSQTSLGPVGTKVLNDGEEHTALLIRKNGITTLWVDGAKDVSAANTHNFAVGADTVLNLGTRYTHGEPITALKDFVTGEGAPSDAQAILMSNWKGAVIEGTIHDTGYVESTQGLWVLTSAYLYEIGPDGAERSKQVNDIGATTIVAFHGGRLVS